MNDLLVGRRVSFGPLPNDQGIVLAVQAVGTGGWVYWSLLVQVNNHVKTIRVNDNIRLLD